MNGNPWYREAVALIPGTLYTKEDIERTRRNIAELLAMTYELGHATGRLAKLDRQRKAGGDER